MQIAKPVADELMAHERGSFDEVICDAAAVLAAADDFDLIVGTSTGGIMAPGLGPGKSAWEIVEFSREQGPHNFPSTSLVERTTGGLRS